MNRNKIASVLLAVVLAPTASVFAVTFPDAYGISFFSNELFKVDSTGTGSSIGVLDQNVNGYGLDFRGDKLYSFNPNTDRIVEIDKNTASTGRSFDIGVGDLLGEGDLAFSSNGTGFLSSALNPDFSVANDLFKFDLDAGTSMRIGSTAAVLDGMAFVGDRLYGIAQEGTPSLYLVDQDTAELTAVGELGIALGSPFSGLAGTADGSLYGILDDRLLMIDLNTGMATNVDENVLDVGFASTSGLAIGRSISRVPDSHLYGALPLTLLLLITIRRRIASRK